MPTEEDKEKLEERKHMLKGLFPKMKSWYNSESVPESLRERYGSYPMFWQDLETWPHIKTMQKLFLSLSEKIDAGENVDVLAAEQKIIAGESSSSTCYDSGVPEEKEDISDAQQAFTSGNASNVVVDVESKKRKKNRWGVGPSDVTTAETSDNAKLSESYSAPAPRKSRWSKDTDAPNLALPAFTMSLPSLSMTPIVQPPSQEQLQQTIVLKMQLQQINERMLTVAQDAARIEADPNRSPSPPPKYDSQGKRTNTRVIRMRDELMQERSKVAEQLMKLNPAFSTPLDMMRSKPVRKIPIPASQMPNQSFIGLIIGPRGNTQKRMEQETNCKISIKGKGMRGSANLPGEEEEELHVFISGDDEAKVEQAAKMVMELLQPRNEELVSKHKENQLRELALINGTLREDEYCPVCGEKGHKQYECPARIKSFKAAGVKCSICGDGSHPTRDCPLKQNNTVGEAVLDSEYDSLMAELNGGTFTSSSNSASLKAITKDQTLSSENLCSNASAITGGEVPVVKKQQTIIHVTSVVTGTGAPPVSYTANSIPNITSTISTPAVTSIPAASYNYPSYAQPQVPQLVTHTPTQAYNYYASNTPVYNPSNGTYYYAPTSYQHATAQPTAPVTWNYAAPQHQVQPPKPPLPVTPIPIQPLPPLPYQPPPPT